MLLWFLAYVVVVVTAISTFDNVVTSAVVFHVTVFLLVAIIAIAFVAVVTNARC